MKNTLLAILWVLSSINAKAGPGSDKTSAWHITVTDKTVYTGIALSNGRIGIMPSKLPFKVESIILNNVYDKESDQGVSKLLKGIDFTNLEMVIDGDTISEKNISGWKQRLDMKQACLTTSFFFRDKAEITYTMYALRGMPYSGLIEVSVRAFRNITMSAAGKVVCPKEYQTPKATFRELKDNEIRMPLLQTVAKSPFGKHTLATTATFIFDHDFPTLNHSVRSPFEHQLSFNREIHKGQDYNFVWAGAVCTTQDFKDPVNESERMAIFLMRGNKSKVIEQHKNLWERLWQGDIEIEGDPESQSDVRLALYHLYSFSREDSDLSIPPMGLSSLNYNGHIFWDTELWMFPPLLVFNQRIARSLLNYRVNRLDKAKQKAENFGYNGAMFPWESDDTGEEATPSWALTGTFEHHITADVGIAFWNYFRLTRDLVWLKQKGFPVMKEIADFWASRAQENSDGSCSILNVVGANEFAPNVDDNAFTNGSVKTILNYTTRAAVALNVEPSEKWKVIADKIKFNYFENGVVKEHRNYNGEIIKQADVNLLAYPLGVVTDPDAIKKDLKYYEPKLSQEGPAMGKSIFAVAYARLGDAEKAYKLFKESYVPNKRPPFGALAETALSNNPYFATGAGGMLQVVLFGFAGLDFTDSGIIQNKPALPKVWKSLTIKGIGVEGKTIHIDNP